METSGLSVTWTIVLLVFLLTTILGTAICLIVWWNDHERT